MTVRIVLTFALMACCRAGWAETPIVFNRDVRPLLASKCFHCHGPDPTHREADLRLDLAESATEDRGGYAAIVAGDPDGSEVIARVTSVDDDLRMPPSEVAKPFSADQVAILRRWIAEGAKYESHWSFVPPRRKDVPADATGWGRNAVDGFVQTRFRSEGLTPAPEADRRTLARRVTLDLTGLPPTSAEIEKFLEDSREDAYDRFVARLLDSPHFGERMALDWLDAARYADTNGYSIDGGRHMWLWRDWVIDAFNQNLPYDTFLLYQLAGDLLPRATNYQRIATGFQRNNMVTHEGGTIPEENLVNYNADRVKTLGEAVLGLTLGCAQCHDHKYDEITQREYYQLFAFFHTISDRGLDGDRGQNPRPVFEATTVLQTEDPAIIRARIAALREDLARPDPAELAAWEATRRRELSERGADLQFFPVRLTGITTPNSGQGFDILDGRHVHITRPSGLAAYDVSLVLPKTNQPITGLRIVFHPDSAAEGGGWGCGKASDFLQIDLGEDHRSAGDEANDRGKGTFILTAVSASAGTVPSDQVNLHRLLDVRRTTANSWAAGFRPENVLDTRRTSGWAPALDHEGPVYLTLSFREPLDPSQTPFLTAQLNFGHGKKFIASRFEVTAFTGKDDGSPLPDDVIEILQTTQSERSATQVTRLREYYGSSEVETAPQRVALANLEERLAVLTERFPTMVMNEAEQPRDTFVLNRGDYQQPGETVSPETPAALPPMPEDAPHNRLGLAQWLTADDHPLTARVAVNRIWQLFFGSGLVATPADFGSQGEYPSHPELLDWLAIEFTESGWDVKSLVRTIVTSATYRQSSVPSGNLLQTDPANRLLARGPRFRLSAEFIRDAALQVSGLLSPTIGGPSVNPYTPGDLWREVSHYGSTPATAQSFVQDHGEKLYRRSLYTYWKRTVPPPNMTVFDAPNRETCVVSRPLTTTPLQALVLLNDTQFVEATRAFAERIIDRGENVHTRIHWAFQECLSRPPSPEESQEIEQLVIRETDRYRADPTSASRYLANGESPRRDDISPVEHAAWSQVAAVLFNLSESVTRN